MTTKAKSAQEPGSGEITRWLAEMREGRPGAMEEVLSHSYHELRAPAAARLARESPGQTLQAAVLVPEGWLCLGVGDRQRFPLPGHPSQNRAKSRSNRSSNLPMATQNFSINTSREEGATSSLSQTTLTREGGAAGPFPVINALPLNKKPKL